MNTLTKLNIKMLVLAMVVSMTAVAQEDENSILSGVTFSGSVDTYYRVNFNTSDDPDEVMIDLDGNEIGNTLAPATSFANQPGFSLGMANFIASFEGDKVGFTADLVFGPRGAEAVFGSGPAQNIVNQLYAYWNVSENVTLTLGNFNTFLGYEVISPTGNFNYSTSYMFSYGPFSHSGLKADLTFGDFTMMLGIFNPTDATDFNPSGEYVGGAQLGYGGAYLNFLFDNDFFQVDLTGGWDLSDTFYFGVNATSASDSFYGGALYLQNSFSESFALGVRGEYWQDEGVGVLSAGERVIDLTLSGNYTVGNLTFIPELRIDAFSEDDIVITNARTGETANSLSSFLLAAVYSF